MRRARMPWTRVAAPRATAALATVFGAALGIALLCTSTAAAELDPLDLALRRAALELSAGRADDAADAVTRLAPLAAQERADIARLLRAESEILCGRLDAAGADLDALARSHDRFVRGQAAA